MSTFLITYHGAMEMPPTPEARDQMMSAFMEWAGTVGDNMVDPGSPLGPSKVVTTDGDTDGKAAGAVGGYTIITADSLDDAVSAVRSHPFLRRGGTLQVSEAVAP
ncbi:MAG: hypothetical protein ACLQFR_31645 [Streptosporangiaceae bacterium]